MRIKSKISRPNEMHASHEMIYGYLYWDIPRNWIEAVFSASIGDKTMKLLPGILWRIGVGECQRRSGYGISENSRNISRPLRWITGKSLLGTKRYCESWVWYIAYPSHSWERKLDEHTNGLIRQYLPKGTSFEGVSSTKLIRISKRINNRPHKALRYRTPPQMRSFWSICSHFRFKLVYKKL